MHNASLHLLPKLYRGAAVRAAEQVAMARFGLDEDDLMVRAGLAAWRLLLDRWPQAQRIGIVCGPGNNGGDGYVLAELARSSGRHVQVMRLSDDVKAGAAGRAADAYLQAGGAAAIFVADDDLPSADVWVDALFGIGLHRALEGAAIDVVAALNHQPSPVLALDVPSGVDADSGHYDGPAVRADVTLSFIAGKPGLYTGRGRAVSGEVMLDTLGLAEHVFDDLEPAARIARPDALSLWLKPRDRNAHKGAFGSVLCIGGDHGFGGAIALCVEAAHRSGAGLVSAATRAEHVAAMLTRRPECMVRAVGSATELKPLLDKASVIAIGPGLGGDEWGETLLEAALAQGLPMVIDADALNLLSKSLETLKNAVFTPHPGEAARLLASSVAEIERDRIASARKLSERYGCVVVWKGAGTIVVAPEQIPVVIDAGNPGMATGGMGDVLTGVIASVIAQGGSCFDAAVCGALLHAAAGDAAARDGGERGLLASDLFLHLRRLANPAPRV
jgi:ADP-dependent NAD(P)H-hydrate dehydratase / NAD(P)H-hydrate epimerase